MDKAKDAPATRNRSATQPASVSLIGCTRCQSTSTAPQHLPQTHRGSAASTDGDSRGSCGSFAALGEKRRERESTSLPQQQSEAGRETEGVRGSEEAAGVEEEDETAAWTV